MIGSDAAFGVNHLSKHAQGMDEFTNKEDTGPRRVATLLKWTSRFPPIRLALPQPHSPQLGRTDGADRFVVYPGGAAPRAGRGAGAYVFETVVCCTQFSADAKYLAIGCNRTAHIYDVGDVLLTSPHTRSTTQHESRRAHHSNCNSQQQQHFWWARALYVPVAHALALLDAQPLSAFPAIVQALHTRTLPPSGHAELLEQYTTAIQSSQPRADWDESGSCTRANLNVGPPALARVVYRYMQTRRRCAQRKDVT
ncbi:hypothetical protein DFH08DRAFT_941369 [Mycena albidolilacea]|uniref:Uncharacterized protein n=1 Tax=Mycena albidolilacea TaxID=1033008 RepID=A0AAD6ZJH5_9AGAR|nr:hypothetical protein DFH08DRAFT_941369 [Mycena albidolilacea]